MQDGSGTSAAGAQGHLSSAQRSARRRWLGQEAGVRRLVDPGDDRAVQVTQEVAARRRQVSKALKPRAMNSSPRRERVGP